MKSFPRPFGIDPNKLFREISKYSRLFKEAMDDGVVPFKEFPCRYSSFKFKELPIVKGISPDKLFSETCNKYLFFKLPTSIGKFPLNELHDKLSNSKERPKT